MFIREPDVIDDHLVVGSKAFGDPTGLPVPEHNVAGTCTRGDVLAIRREADATGVSSNGVASKAFLLVLAERTIGRIDQDLIVQGLARKVFI